MASSACMRCRVAVVCWAGQIVPPVVKYTFSYLFAQSRFGLLCPVSATDTCVVLINYASDEDQQRYLPGSAFAGNSGMNCCARCAVHDRKAGGSDVSQSALTAQQVGDHC